LIAPIPSRNAGMGWTLAVPASLLYRPGFLDPEDPPWITGVLGFYAENESWGAGLFHRMNLDNDRWRILGALFYSDINYNVYDIGNSKGNPDRYVEVGQEVFGGILEGLREVMPHLYIGLRGKVFQTEIHSLRLPKYIAPEFDLPFRGVRLDLVSLVPRLVYDTRDNEFYPTSGNFVNAEINLDSKEWGSDFDYQIYSADWNYYLGLTENQVLAFRGAGQYASGSVPFFLLPAMGKGSDLRGFKPGIFRDKVLLTGQAEYRHRITRRLGAVAFYGLGKIGPEWDDLGETLYSGGVGLRWLLAKQNNISFRLDIAWAQDDPEYYVSVGEAF
jgi:outer membrane protein assembly factor BamA